MADVSPFVPSSMPQRADVLARVQQLLQQILSLESADTIRPTARLLDDLNIDSLGMVDVVLGIEEEFGIKLGSDINLFERVVTVDDAVDLITAMSQAQHR
jgi:acyl carrier protein